MGLPGRLVRDSHFQPGKKPADMSKALSLDLCVRALEAVYDGVSHRTATNSRDTLWCKVGGCPPLAQADCVEGDPRLRTLGRDHRSSRIESHLALFLGVLTETPDIVIEELGRQLADVGLTSATARSSASVVL